MRFEKLTQKSINGDCSVIIALDSHETKSLSLFTDAQAHQYASEALRAVGFSGPKKVTDWTIVQILKRGQRFPQTTLEVEYQ